MAEGAHVANGTSGMAGVGAPGAGAAHPGVAHTGVAPGYAGTGAGTGAPMGSGAGVGGVPAGHGLAASEEQRAADAVRRM